MGEVSRQTKEPNLKTEACAMASVTWYRTWEEDVDDLDLTEA